MTIDHAAEALDALGCIAGVDEKTNQVTMAIEAQVHATLALAEQQRISNLVALYTNPSAEVATAMEASGVSFSALIRQIKEGMGLS